MADIINDNEVTFEMIVQAINYNGFTQGQLRAISDAAVNRRRFMAQAESATLMEGDRVRVNREVKPLYLAGKVGRVTGRKGDRIMVVYDPGQDYRLYKGTGEWRMTAGSIKKIEEI